MTEKPTTKSFFSEWLEKLQQESWQLELLISGLALYGVIELGPFIEDLKVYHVLNTSGFTSFLTEVFVKVAEAGWIIFIVNLLVHIILRGLWIGAIGLRYVSKEIEYDDLNYAPRFTNYLRTNVGDYDDFIEKLEKFCSVLFAFTFLLFLFFVSLMVFSLIGSSFFHIGKSFLDKDSMIAITILLVLIFLYWGIGLLVFLDFITLGAFKKIEDETFSKIYFNIYRFYSVVTLSFLYRPLLYNFIDNQYTKRFFFASVIYILSILLFNKLLTNDNYPHFPDNEYGMTTGDLVNDNCYDDLRLRKLSAMDAPKKEVLPMVSIDQYINTKSHMTFFLRMFSSDQDLLAKKAGVDPFRKAGLRFGLFRKITYDDSVIDSLEKSRKTESINIYKLQIEMTKSGIRAKNRGEDVSRIIVQLDSLKNVRKGINKKYKKLKEIFNDGKLGRIKENLLNHIDLYMDSIPINNKINCQFYIHPNLNEKGLLCMHDIEEYSDGVHELIVERKSYKLLGLGNDSMFINKVILPFYKKKSNE